MTTAIKFLIQMADRLNKRNDPNYKQVIGYVHIDVVSEFRAICVQQGLSVSEAIEVALKSWNEQNRKVIDEK